MVVLVCGLHVVIVAHDAHIGDGLQLLHFLALVNHFHTLSGFRLLVGVHRCHHILALVLRTMFHLFEEVVKILVGHVSARAPRDKLQESDKEQRRQEKSYQEPKRPLAFKVCFL